MGTDLLPLNLDEEPYHADSSQWDVIRCLILYSLIVTQKPKLVNTHRVYFSAANDGTLVPKNVAMLWAQCIREAHSRGYLHAALVRAEKSSRGALKVALYIPVDGHLDALCGVRAQPFYLTEGGVPRKLQVIRAGLDVFGAGEAPQNIHSGMVARWREFGKHQDEFVGFLERCRGYRTC